MALGKISFFYLFFLFFYTEMNASPKSHENPNACRGVGYFKDIMYFTRQCQCLQFCPWNKK